jgi:hypothetical protein
MGVTVDGGWAWVVLAVSFCSNLLNSVLYYNIGLVQKALLDKYGGNVATTATIGATFSCLSQVVGECQHVGISKHSDRKMPDTVPGVV